MEDQPEELNLDADEFISFCAERNREDRGRAEDAGASRQKIGQFMEKTGVNGKALSFFRMILKTRDKKNGDIKAQDILRSTRELLEITEAEVIGQGTGQLGLGNPADYESEDETANAAPEEGDDVVPMGDVELADDAAGFEANLAELDEGEDSNVTPMTRAAE